MQTNCMSEKYMKYMYSGVQSCHILPNLYHVLYMYSLHDDTGCLQIKAKVLFQYNSGLKLIKQLILLYVYAL